MNKKRKNTTVIPYNNGISEKLTRILKKGKIRVAHKLVEKIHQFMRSVKDKNDKLLSSGIYKIKCGSCPKEYVGESKRPIKERVKEHERHIRLNQKEKSAVAEHALDNGHDIEWDKTVKIYPDKGFWKRKLENQ